MEKGEIYSMVKTEIIVQLGVKEEEVTMEANLEEDLAADSLDLVELMMALEEKFQISIDDKDTEEIETVNDIVECIARLQLRKK